MDVSSSLSIFSKFRVSGEVFIHYLGDDIHRNFVSHLSSSLLQAGVKPSLVAVEMLSEKFMPSITRFQIGIVVFTKAYIESSRCVEDLLRIIECHENHGLIVMPVFYDIDPSDLFDLKMDSSSYVRDPMKGELKKNSSKVHNSRSARSSVKTTLKWTLMKGERFNYISNHTIHYCGESRSQ